MAGLFRPFSYPAKSRRRRSYNPGRTRPPVWALPRSLAATKGISGLISFPAGTEMFQFPAFALRGLWIQPAVTGYDPCRVAPFGNPRIKGCLRLPEAYRSLPRPSSLPGA